MSQCDDDHIFPRSQFKRHPGIDSILNRTLITRESNRIRTEKSDKKPSEYLPLFLAKHGGNDTKLRETLASHFITEQAIQAMQVDDLDGFLKAREAEFVHQLRTLFG